ncbi:hypothetical protein D3C84_991670 [compost metagenome]
MDVDMRTGRKGWQQRAIGAGQVKDDHAVPLQLALVHHYIQKLFIHGDCSM